MASVYPIEPTASVRNQASKLTFTVAGAPIVSVFVRPKVRPPEGKYLTLTFKDGKHTGSLDAAAKDGGLAGGVSVGHVWSPNPENRGARFSIFVGQTFGLVPTGK
jgi:hypothetical protein